MERSLYPLIPQRQLPKILKLHGLPGTGKTTKAIRLATNYGVTTKTVVMETFRKNMAEQLKQDSGLGRSPLIGTLHSICLYLLTREGIVEKSQKKNVITPKDMKEFCKREGIVYSPPKWKEEDIGLPKTPHQKQSAGEILFSINSLLIANLRPVEKWRELYGELGFSIPYAFSDDFVISTLEAWKDYKIKIGKIEYIDMLWLVLENKFSPDVEVIVSDEFQDKTPIMFAILGEWIKDASYVIIAGDPFQCIYTFWGANPAFFEELEGELEILPHSYRVPHRIWRFAHAILTDVGYVVPELETHSGGSLEMILTEPQLREIIVTQKYANNFFLVRTNHMTRRLAGILESLGVPFAGNYGWNPITVAAYNALLKLSQYEIAFGQVVGEPLTGNEVQGLANILRKPIFRIDKKNKDANVPSIDKLRGAISPSKLHQAIVKPEIYPFARRGYEAGILKQNKLVEKGTKKAKRLGLALLNFRKPIREVPLTYLGTIHSSKGLEADNIFLFGDTTPKVEDARRRDPQSEARVFFVGATRARKALYLLPNFFGRDVYPLPTGVA